MRPPAPTRLAWQRRPARCAAGALLAVALLGVSACNGDNGATTRTAAGATTSAAPSPSPAASKSPRPAESTPTPTPTAKLAELTEKTLVPALQQALKTHRSVHMRMQISSNGMSMTADGHSSYGPHPAMRMTMAVPQLGAGKIELRFVGDTAYIAIPPMTPPGKFVKFDAGDPNSPLGPDLGQIRGQLDPSRTFDGFKAGLKSVEYLGVESVDGEPTGHYVLTVSSAAALKALGQTVPPGTPETVTYDLLLDRHNLMRRLKMKVAGTGIKISADEWGKPVHVHAPPAKDVITLSALNSTNG